MGELTTLDKIDARFSEEDKTRRNILLLLASHLSSLQLNIAHEIEQIYKKIMCIGLPSNTIMRRLRS